MYLNKLEHFLCLEFILSLFFLCLFLLFVHVIKD